MVRNLLELKWSRGRNGKVAGMAAGLGGHGEDLGFHPVSWEPLQILGRGVVILPKTSLAIVWRRTKAQTELCVTPQMGAAEGVSGGGMSIVGFRTIKTEKWTGPMRTQQSQG